MPLLICENWPNNMTCQGVKLQQLQEKMTKNIFDTRLVKASSSNTKVFLWPDMKSVSSTFKL